MQHIAPIPISLSITEKVSHHPLVKAFTQTEYGQLRLRTPDGQLLSFIGKRPGPKAYLRLNHWHALDALLTRGEIGFAEAYMQAEWDTDDLPALLTFGLLNADVLERYFYGRPWHALWLRVKNLFLENSVAGGKRNIRAHYDLGNDFYALWLDKSMTYSCALFQGNETLSLEDAQQAKYHRILDKLDLPAHAHVLEIGCGWGGFAEAAARRGLKVTSITNSQAQQQFAQARMKKAKLHKAVEVQLKDYRQITGKYDGIVSIGMFEHVGSRYWPIYFQTIRNHLKPGGKAMVQSITIDETVYARTLGKTGFIEHYIFPGGELPSPPRFKAEAEKAGLLCHEMFAFGEDYARTLTHWLERFEAKKEIIKQMGYDETFLHMWRFYLSSCIASFLSKRSSVMQAELTLAA